MDIGIIRDPSHTFGITGNGNTSIVIPTERSDEESRKRKAKRDPSHTFGMTGNCIKINNKKYHELERIP